MDIEADQADSDQDRREKAETLLRKFITAIIFTIPFYTTMGPLIGMPLPKIISPDANPLNFGFIQLILVIPVMAAGYRFILSVSEDCLKRAQYGFSDCNRHQPAFLYSIYSIIWIINGDHQFAHEGLYFETAGVILTLILLGSTWNPDLWQTSEAIKKLMGDFSQDRRCHTGRDRISILLKKWKWVISSGQTRREDSCGREV